MERGTRKAAGCCRQHLTGYPHRSLEDSSGEGDGDCRGLAQKVSKGSKDFHSNRARGHSCDTLAKNLAVFCLCLESLPKAKLKRNGITSLEISRLHNVKFMSVCY